MVSAVATKKKGKVRQVRAGNVYVRTTYNNTIITVTDLSGNALVWSSSGRAGFSGARKSTPYAAQQVVRNIASRLTPYGMEQIHVYVRGIGSARESAVRALAAAGLNIASIRDVTPIPHNGVRPPKRRRV